jgi:hypothetical protein
MAAKESGLLESNALIVLSSYAIGDSPDIAAAFVARASWSVGARLDLGMAESDGLAGILVEFASELPEMQTATLRLYPEAKVPSAAPPV